MNSITKARSIQASLARFSSVTKKSVSTNRLGVQHLLSRNIPQRSNTYSFFSTIGEKPLTSFTEPDPTLFNGNRFNKSVSSVDVDDPDKQLRADVKTMGTILGSIIKAYEGEDILNQVESLRLSAKDWREAGAGRDEAKKRG